MVVKTATKKENKITEAPAIVEEAPTVEVEAKVLLPPQPLPLKKSLFGQVKITGLVPAIVIKETGIYLNRQVKETDLPQDARLWRYKNGYIYSLLETKDGKFQIFEPTGESEQLPEKLWRAVKAPPIRQLFSFKKNRLQEAINNGLGVTFVIVCIIILFVVGNMLISNGAGV